MKSERRIQRIETAIRYSQCDLTVVLENIHDPHNVSAILRSCDAVGVRRVRLVYTTESFPKIGRQSSASAGKWVERDRFKSIEDCYDSLRRDGYVIGASVLADDSISIYDLELRKKTALVFGNEHRGVSEEAARNADILFKIPMRGMIQSLNVSVACAVSLYEALRQRLSEREPGSHMLSQEDMELSKQAWLKK